MRQIIKRLFSERRVAIQSRGKTRHLNLTRGAQIAGLCVLLVGISAIARVTAGYVVAARKMAHKEAAVAQAETSNTDLRSLVTELQQRLAVATSDNAQLRKDTRLADQRMRAIDETRAMLQAQREDALTRLKGAEDALNTKSSVIARVSHSLDSTKSDLKTTEQQRLGLTARVRQLETDLQDTTDRAAQLKTAADSADQKLQQITADRAKIIAERDRLSNRVASLEAKAESAAAAAKVASIPAEPVRIAVSTTADSTETTSTLGRLANGTRQGWGDVRKLLASAGVDLDQLATRLGAVPGGQGGPYIAARDVKLGDTMPENAQKLLKTLPLSAPLDHYQLESGFGGRVDPLNHKGSFHAGLDFSAPYRSPIYNTAPGVVISAGPKGDFGKMVEIDHGDGIVTRYAHMNRVLVAPGQHLTGRQEIGLLGSTGRSTGPHVHYEIVVNGQPQDPEKFLMVGKSTVVQVTAAKQ